jgi:prolyl 4-hydroxylase
MLPAPLISATRRSMLMSSIFVLLAATTSLVSAELNDLNQEIYGFDTTWAVTSKEIEWPHIQGLYNDFIDNCQTGANDKHKAKAACVDGEDFRFEMNTHQPKSMRNYTRMGFKKIKAPPEMFALIKEFWETNREKNETEWHSINTYHNMWDAPPTLVNIQMEEKGGGPELTQKVWEQARLTLEDWTGMHLSPCSIWGIRIYQNNSILATHVDRNPLVTSAIINVDQDVDEPWPLEVWGHDGTPYNITMEPGDMVLYESHSILHGT